MAIPDYQKIMLPLLKFAEDKKEHSIREAIDYISKLFSLSEEEKRILLPSGQQPIINNRTGWARTYLKKARLLETTKRSFFKITDKGVEVLKKNPQEIDRKYLEQFPDFLEFITLKRSEIENPDLEKEQQLNQQTPEEILGQAYEEIKHDLAQELLTSVKTTSPYFFEKLVIDLLLKMGYGGYLPEAGEITGKSGDGGIDGKIKEDKLGLDVIYIQAKRWDGTVGRPEIHKFAGALLGQRAKKGIFITTSNFSKDARDYAESIDAKIRLIDGNELADLMIDYDIGVSKVETFELKKIDTDYFIED
ncbi:MAG: restriction endonuclease [Candidatus Methanoperedens sp.]|nr:restriction endonuclease [Candidatus Methanoperedens sp.]